MATTEKTPLWLDLKKEYIDDNFEKLQAYLRDSDEKGSKDAFYTTTIELFRERITDLLRDISERPVFADEQERQILTTNVSMLATLRQMNPTLSDLIVRTVMQRICHEKVSSLGFSWKDLEKLGTELFVHNTCKLARFEVPLSKPQILTKYGTAILMKNALMLTHDNMADSKKLINAGTNSLDTGIGITLRTVAGQKLKQRPEYTTNPLSTN